MRKIFIVRDEMDANIFFRSSSRRLNLPSRYGIRPGLNYAGANLPRDAEERARFWTVGWGGSGREVGGIGRREAEGRYRGSDMAPISLFGGLSANNAVKYEARGSRVRVCLWRLYLGRFVFCVFCIGVVWIGRVVVIGCACCLVVIYLIWLGF